MSDNEPEGSLFFQLHPPQTEYYEDALLADALKYRIGVGLNPRSDDVGPGYYVTETGVILKTFKPPKLLPVSHPVPKRSAASVPMAAGGYYAPAISQPPQRLVVPLTPTPPPAARDHAVPAVPPSEGSAAPPAQTGEGAPAVTPSHMSSRRRTPWSGYLKGEESCWELRELAARDMIWNDSGSTGYTLAFNIHSLKNIAAFKARATAAPEWEILLGHNGQPQIIRLMIDTASGDSWTFCDMHPDDYMKDSPPEARTAYTWRDCLFKHLYDLKPVFPRPPNDMMGPEQQADINYGTERLPVFVRTTQTVCKLSDPQRTTSQYHYSMFPIGLVIESDPTMLWRCDDGLLGLGTGTGSYTSYRDPAVNWLSQPFHWHLYKKRKIANPVFWISVGHPDVDLDVRPLNFIMFGDFVHPTPWTSYSFAKFKRIPIDLSGEPHTIGKWALKLRYIAICKGNALEEVCRIPVECLVIIDSGATQSYFPDEVMRDINDHLATRWDPAVDHAPKFAWDDWVVFSFHNRETGLPTNIVSQARRFFNSGLRSKGVLKPATLGTASTGSGILGLNFFRSFTIGFDESGNRTELCFHPQCPVQYAD